MGLVPTAFILLHLAFITPYHRYPRKSTSKVRVEHITLYKYGKEKEKEKEKGGGTMTGGKSRTHES